MDRILQRHDLLRASPAVWSAMLSMHPGLDGVPLVADWAHRQRPVIVRRRFDGEAADAIPVALPLPPAFGKRRVALGFDPGVALDPLPVVRLEHARGSAPEAWQPTIDALIALGEEVSSSPRVFGALLWQHLTGLTYLSPASDLDLLWDPADPDDAARLVESLASLDERGPVRLDGEIILPDGGGVNWREFLGTPDALLVKTMRGVEMRPFSGAFG